MLRSLPQLPQRRPQQQSRKIGAGGGLVGAVINFNTSFCVRLTTNSAARINVFFESALVSVFSEPATSGDTLIKSSST